jgi:hypothetical protein
VLQKLNVKLNKCKVASSRKQIVAKEDLANASKQLEDKDTECVHAVTSLAFLRQQGASMVGVHEKMLTSVKEWRGVQVRNLQQQLKEQKEKTKKIQKKLWQLQQPAKKGTQPKRSDLPPAVQLVVDRAELDAVTALESVEEFKQNVVLLKAENAVLLKKLSLSSESLAKALDEIKGRDNDSTNWVNVLGQKGRKYDIMVKELGIQLMASEMSASQAVYCVTVFMMKTYPNLSPGVDYRVPSASSFKEWGEVSHPVCCISNCYFDIHLIYFVTGYL